MSDNFQSRKTENNDTHVIISRATDDAANRTDYERQLTEACVNAGLDVFSVPHIYHLQDDAELWHSLAGLEGNIAAFTWLHPRPAEWILRRHGVSAGKLRTYSLAAFSTVRDAMDALRGDYPEITDRSERPGELKLLQGTTTRRWYPVRDASRCDNCGHCLQFCIFGVWDTDDDDCIYAAEPDNCKAGCPACARVCPNAAIMFPLYEHDDAIAGAPGEFVTLDADARKMYYVRTGTECPVCGLHGEVGVQLNDEAPVCPECGRCVPDAEQRLADAQGVAGETDSTPAKEKQDATVAEIDRLIDDLDRLTDRS